MNNKYKLALIMIIYCLIVMVYPISASPLRQDPLESMIEQVMEATYNDLRFNPSPNWKESTPSLSGNRYLYDSSNVFEITIYHYLNINDATNSLSGIGCTHFTFHGYPASICTDTVEDGIGTLGGILGVPFSGNFQVSNLVFNCYGASSASAKSNLEVLYRNAVTYGLIMGDGNTNIGITPTVTPEQEQVGIQITADGFETKDYIFTSVNPISVISIEGYVVDSLGDAIEGATISLLDSSFVEKSGPDGYFNISAYAKDQGKPFAISQNFPLVSKMQFTSEILEKDRNGNSYSGVIADGTSLLTLKVNLPVGADPNKIFISCDVSEDENNFTNFTDPCAAPVIQQDTLLISINPLEKFIKPYDIRVELSYAKDDGSRKGYFLTEIRVIHPPVVLIHGIWSSRAAMIPLRTFLNNSGGFPYLILADYSATSYGEIRNNVSALQTAVNRAFELLETNGYYGKRVDIVAHSMGGLISRLYMLGYTATDGSAVPGQGQNIRKLITLSTPHLGSPLGDWYVELDPPGMFDCPGLTIGVSDWEGSHTPYKDEYEYILKKIRTKMGLRSDALAYGKGAHQLSTMNNLVLDALNDKQRSVGNQQNEFYFLAGDKAFLNEWWGNVAAEYAPKLLYMHSGMNPGPCGQTYMENAFKEMVIDFINFSTASDTDGVVQVNSSLGNSIGIQPVEAKTVPFNHFTITEAGSVWRDVYLYLTGAPTWLAGTYFFKGSPGVLHIYDNQGRHVGPSEIGIPGATYEEFEDVTGQHTLIYVPDDGEFNVNVDVAEAGTVNLEINQGSVDGWRWTRYEDIEVESGSQIVLYYDRENPQGQVINADNETTLLAPTFNEIISDVNAETIIDLVKPAILSFIPEDGTIVPVDGTFLMASFLDNTGGCGIDPNAVKLFVDGEDHTQLAEVDAATLTMALSTLGAGEHTARLIVADLDGNMTVAESTFISKANLLSQLSQWSLTLLIGVGVGLLILIAMIVGLIIFLRRKSRQPKQVRSHKKMGCGFSILITTLMALLVFGFFVLVALDLIPIITLTPSPQPNVDEILKLGGGGLLLTVLGAFMLRGGYRSIKTRQVLIEDDIGRQREKRGLSAVINGIGQVTFGILFLIGGLGLIGLTLVQQILPMFIHLIP